MYQRLRAIKGFTLIELLVVIAILSILLVIVLVAISPARQTRDARNLQRQADVLTILNAVNQHFVEDDSGDFPSGTPGAGVLPAVEIKSAGGGTGQAFCDDLVPDFIAELPIDPSDTATKWDRSLPNPCTDYNTGYTIEVSATDDRVTITAPSTEGGIQDVKATR